MPKAQRILITGGSGLLGRCLTPALSERDPVVFDVSSTGSNVEFVQGSILSVDALTQAARRADTVIHAAALRPRGRNEEEVFAVNTLGTWNALQAAEAAGCTRFVFISSECATGLCFQRDERLPDFLPVDERHPLRPADAYSVSKLLGEEIVAAFRRRSSMRIVVLRPLYILFDEEADSVPTRQDTWHPDLWGYVDPQDVVDAILAVIDKAEPSSTYFLGAPDTLCEEPTLNLVRRRFGRLPAEIEPNIFQARPTAAIFDSRKAERELGITFRSTWRERLAKATGS